MIEAVLRTIVAAFAALFVAVVVVALVAPVVRFVGGLLSRQKREQLRARRRRAEIDRDLDIYEQSNRPASRG